MGQYCFLEVGERRYGYARSVPWVWSVLTNTPGSKRLGNVRDGYEFRWTIPVVEAKKYFFEKQDELLGFLSLPFRSGDQSFEFLQKNYPPQSTGWSAIRWGLTQFSPDRYFEVLQMFAAEDDRNEISLDASQLVNYGEKDCETRLDLIREALLASEVFSALHELKISRLIQIVALFHESNWQSESYVSLSTIWAWCMLTNSYGGHAREPASFLLAESEIEHLPFDW